MVFDSWKLVKELYPICRSITGVGFRDSLDMIKRLVPQLEYTDVPTGYRAFDWEVPLEWNIEDAYILDKNNKKVVDFKKNNLHVVGYSCPIDETISISNLEKHLHSLPDQPDVIPYVTSYYKHDWGFCLTHNARKSLVDDNYRVVIKSHLEAGFLRYAELYLPGESSEEIFFSTYLCHPSMANNELSGPAVMTGIMRYLVEKKDRKKSYRCVILPETIGSIVYLSKNVELLKSSVIAGFNLTCIGDNAPLSYLPSRKGDTLADKAVKYLLKSEQGVYKKYTWLDRGSDERQYCAPGVDLPVASIMRSKYGEYPEYHTSADNLEFISKHSLDESIRLLVRLIDWLDANERPKVSVLCEPQLVKHGLYPSKSTKGTRDSVRTLTDIISLSDGKSDLFDISTELDVSIDTVIDICSLLKARGITR